MKVKKEDIPVTMEVSGTVMRVLPGWGGMTVAFNDMPAVQTLSFTMSHRRNS